MLSELHVPQNNCAPICITILLRSIRCAFPHKQLQWLAVISEVFIQHAAAQEHFAKLGTTVLENLSFDACIAYMLRLPHMTCSSTFEMILTVMNVLQVTFLYKLTDGACPKSYGVNVARLAGLPDDIVKRASSFASQLEAQHESQSLPSLSKHELNKLCSICQGVQQGQVAL